MEETNNEYVFDDEYQISTQKKFLSLLVLDREWSKLSGIDLIRPEYFESIRLKNICTWIHRYYKQYKELPSDLVLKEEVTKFINDKGLSEKEYYNYDTIINEIFAIENKKDLDFFKDKAIGFIRQVAWKKALAKGGDALKLNNFNEAINTFKEALHVGANTDLGMDSKKLSPTDLLNNLREAYDPKEMIKTGIPAWDAALGGGFVKNNLHILAAPPGAGKAISCNTLIGTPNGWKKAGEIKVGDYLIGRDGNPTKVLAVYPQGVISNYKVVFNDGVETNCCENHLWTVIDMKSNLKKWKVYSLKEIIEKGLFKPYSPSRQASGRKPAVRWKIPLVEPVNYSEKEYIIHPYNMGVLLGDGCLCIKSDVRFSNSSKDIFIKNKFESFLPNNLKLSQKKMHGYKNECEQYSVIQKEKELFKNQYINEIKRLGLAGTKSETKFIPEEYKFGSVEQRLELLRGLMDTDGTIGNRNRIGYASINKKLAEDVLEIVQSLGGMGEIKIRKHKSTKFECGYYEYYVVRINLNKINPFSLPRKAEKWYPTNRGRYIVDIIKQEDADSICFKVDNTEELFVIEHYIVTHNSRSMAFLTKQALMDFKRVVFITLELTEEETYANIASAITGLTMHDMLCKENEEEFTEKFVNFNEQYNSDLFVKFYRPGTTNADTVDNYIQQIIRDREHAGIKNWKPDVIFLDYMDKMIPTQKVKGNTYEDIGGIANDCKNLAITYGCPVITGSQLGRISWTINNSEVISMDNIAESAMKVHLAHSMTTLNANPGEKLMSKVRLYLAKSRSGKPGQVIYCEQELGKCLMYETTPWDPAELQAEAGFAVKSTGGSSKK